MAAQASLGKPSIRKADANHTLTLRSIEASASSRVDAGQENATD
jgi:hypothetical protein